MSDTILPSPRQSPYLTQYLGVWAILDAAADLLWDKAAALDWSAHVAKQHEQRMAAAAGERKPAMYSYALTGRRRGGDRHQRLADETGKQLERFEQHGDAAANDPRRRRQ
jgi:hypothetical protein